MEAYREKVKKIGETIEIFIVILLFAFGLFLETIGIMINIFVSICRAFKRTERQ